MFIGCNSYLFRDDNYSEVPDVVKEMQIVLDSVISKAPIYGVELLYRVLNDFLQSAFSKTELIDLYINEKRDIDNSDYQDLSNIGNFIMFKKFHFYFVGSSLDETISGQTAYKNCCLLDAKKWKDYIGTHNPESRKCIAYHWKIDTINERCSVFLRTVYTSLDKFKIFKYLFIAFSVSFFASFIYDILKSLISK